LTPVIPAAENSEVAGADSTRRTAVAALFLGILAIAIGYGSAFARTGTPQWAAWLLAIGIPLSVGAIMILGAARGQRGVGSLKIPFAFVIAMLAMGFCAALALPATESEASRLWLGLPLRAAVIIYGIGLLPIVVLPVAYAVTFKTQTLTADDVARVRALGERYRAISSNESVPSEGEDRR
jgi:drug/metabolite transporter (DMT)-like permease